MPIYSLHPTYLGFPDPSEAEDGLLAVHGDLSVERLLQAYSKGIFPWYSDEEPIMWWSPDPRCILWLEKLKTSKSMRKVIRQTNFTVTFDMAFPQVIKNCQQAPRKGQEGTWITEEMQQAYIALHEKGFAHSVEVWLNKELVGGLYGVSLGKAFFGESMFSKESNASKLALIKLRNKLQIWGFEFIDCQVYNDHLGSMGAEEITRESFLLNLERSLQSPSQIGSWTEK